MWFIKMASMIHPSGSALLIKVELPWSEEKAPSLLCQHPLVSSLTTGILRPLSRKLWVGGGGGGEQRLNVEIERFAGIVPLFSAMAFQRVIC